MVIGSSDRLDLPSVGGWQDGGTEISAKQRTLAGPDGSDDGVEVVCRSSTPHCQRHCYGDTKTTDFLFVFFAGFYQNKKQFTAPYVQTNQELEFE